MKFVKISFAMVIILLLVFIMYSLNIDKKKYYVSIGDNLAIGYNSYNKIDYGYADYVSDYLKKHKLLKQYINNYSKPSYDIPNLISDIKLNTKTRINNKEVGLKQVISDSDIITLSIGTDELINSISTNLEYDDFKSIYKDTNILINDLKELIDIIRKYYKKELIIIGYYYPKIITDIKKETKINDLFIYIYEVISKISNKYNIKYINTNQILNNKKEYFINNNSIYPNSKAYTLLGKEIISIIKKNND